MAWAIHESKGHGPGAAARGRGSTNVGRIPDEEPRFQDISRKLYNELRPLEFVFERPKLNWIPGENAQRNLEERSAKVRGRGVGGC